MKAALRKNDEYFSTDHLKSDIKKHAMRGAGASLLASSSSFVIQFSSTVILTRLLTPADYGLITMVTAISLLFASFGVTGFSEAIIQRDELDHETMSTVFWITTAGSATLTILFFLIAPVLAWFYKEPRLCVIGVAVAFSIISDGIGAVHMALLRRNMQFSIASRIQIVARFTGVVIAIIMAWAGLGYWALVANTIAWPLLISAGGWIFCKWRPGLPKRGTAAMSITRFALHTYGNFFLNYSSRNIDKLLIGWRYAAGALGFYKKAYDLFVLPASQIISPLNDVALAALSRIREQPDKYRRYYLDAVSAIAFVGMPLSAFLTVSGSDIVLFVLGPQWTKAGEVFSYLGASIGIMLIYGTQGWLHLSLGRPDRWVRWSVIECVITACFFVAGLPFGIEGVAVAYAVSFYCLIWPCLAFAGKPIDLQFSLILKVIWPPFLAALLAGVVTIGILRGIASVSAIFDHFYVAVRIVTAGLLCGCTYLLMTVILHGGIKPIRQFTHVGLQLLPKRNGSK